MELIRKQLNINFLGARVPALVLSVLLMLASIGLLATKGLNFGLDFTGGIVLEVGYPTEVNLGKVRDTLAEQGYPDAVVQHFGTTSEALIRLQPDPERSNADISSAVFNALRAEAPAVDMRRVEFVGPQVGEQLTNQGIQAMMFALLGILIYVSARFQWKLSVGAVAALAHDTLLVLGMFSLLNIPFDLTVLAAILAMIGYSLNDTIVIYDRIRENFRLMRSQDRIDVINASINQTMARTIMTGITTLLVLVALFYFGGEVFYGFSIALIAGVIIGTYSSIYVAGAVSLMLNLTREDLLPLKEKEPLDDMP